MNKKIIATILALGMVATAFAMMAAPVNAANYHGWWFIDNVGGDLRIRDSNGGVNPNGGSARFWKVTEPTYYMQNFNTPGGLPWVGMSDWIGAGGQSATDYAAFMQTTGAAGPSDVLAGNVCGFVLEMDANVTLSPRVYYSTIDGPAGYGWTQRGTTPNGYIWAGTDTATASPDDEVIPGTSPATTFYEMYQMPKPSAAGNIISWSFPAHEADVIGNTIAQIQSWVLMEGPAANDNDGPWTSVGTAAYGSTITYTPQNDFYYCVRVIWVGPINSPVLSQAKKLGGTPPSTFAPQVALPTETGVILAGNIANEFVTITATVSTTDGHNVGAANIEIPTGGAVYNMTTSSPVGTSRVYTYTYDLPNGQAEAPVAYRIHGMDGVDLWNATWRADTFTYVDSTAPLVAWDSVPGANAFVNQPLVFTATYADFSDYQTALANSYFTYTVNAGAPVNVAWTNASFAWGSYTNDLTATIPAGTFVAGDSITYGGRVRDTAATPLTTILAAGGPIVMDDPPTFLPPFPVYGMVELYDGNAGVYTPIAAPAGTPISVSWFNASLGALDTKTDVTSGALGQYSIDIWGAVDANPLGITITAGPFPVYGNLGHNWTAISATETIGGVWRNVTCGIPYEVIITAPLNGDPVTSSAAFPVTWRILDIDGNPARGYFSRADDMVWTSSDALATLVGPRNIDGTTSGFTGTTIDLVTLVTGGPQWINISEGIADWYPSIFGAFSVNGVPGWLDDFHNITLIVAAGGFEWQLSTGWNLVSCPQDGTYRVGANPFFDSQDALAWVNAYLFASFGEGPDALLEIADRTGPGAYASYVVGAPEAAAYALDTTSGYWVFYSLIPTRVIAFEAVNATTSATSTVTVAVVAGWNLMGYQHNYTATIGWTAYPTASDFTDGTIAAFLDHADLGGARDKIVVTEWTSGKYYNSYVVDTGFPGMGVRDWAWNAFSDNPGNGFWLWVDVAGAVTYSTVI